MELLCKIFGHKFKYICNFTSIGPGEPLPNGGAAYGVPMRCKLYRCSRCGKEKGIREHETTQS